MNKFIIVTDARMAHFSHFLQVDRFKNLQLHQPLCAYGWSKMEVYRRFFELLDMYCSYYNLYRKRGEFYFRGIPLILPPS